MIGFCNIDAQDSTPAGTTSGKHILGKARKLPSLESQSFTVAEFSIFRSTYLCKLSQGYFIVSKLQPLSFGCFFFQTPLTLVAAHCSFRKFRRFQPGREMVRWRKGKILSCMPWQIHLSRVSQGSNSQGFSQNGVLSQTIRCR